MSAKRRDTKSGWIDPDDAPEWTDEMFDRAQIAVGGKVVRQATGTLTKRGRPPVGDEPKQQVTLRLAPKVINYFKQGGEGWQTRLNETLEDYVAAAVVAEVRKRSLSINEVASKLASDVIAAAAKKKRGLSGSATVRSSATGRLGTSPKKSSAKRNAG